MVYSFELKDRVVKALDGGTPLKTVARLLGISRSTVYRWKRKAENSESLKPKNKGGRPPKIKNLDTFKQFVEQRSDRTLKEIANDWGNISQWAVYRAMKKISYTYKKKALNIKKRMMTNELNTNG